MKYFVTAIGTDSGKTVVSAILCKALGYDYWKPVQAGILDKDVDTVSTLSPDTNIHPEAYVFREPMSPHASAEIDGVELDITKINLPEADDLIVEGAGGLLVPLNRKELIVDLIEKFDIEVVLVINNYLGSINHSLLTINELKRRGVQVKGIIFNGPTVKTSEDFILNYSGYECLLRVQKHAEFTPRLVDYYAKQITESFE